MWMKKNCKDKYIEEKLKENNHDFDKTLESLISEKKIKNLNYKSND